MSVQRNRKSAPTLAIAMVSLVTVLTACAPSAETVDPSTNSPDVGPVDADVGAFPDTVNDDQRRIDVAEDAPDPHESVEDTSSDWLDVADSDAFQCDAVIAIDGPCIRPFRCTDAKHYIRLETRSCGDQGFDPRCCMGAGCAELPGGECPDGTLCLESMEAPCVPIDCGRLGDPSCPGTDEYCARPPAECGASLGGVCLPIGACGYHDGWTLEYGWICGCDGNSYRTDCAARTVGVSRAATLPCCDPSRMDFTQDNPVGYTAWVACLAIDGVANTNDLLMVGGAECTWLPGDVLAMGCAEGEWACRGELFFEPGTTRIHPEWWPHVCGVTGLPGVRAIHGIGDPENCSDIGCAEAPRCQEPCSAPCGCCPCVQGAFRCGSQDNDVPIGYEECQFGCWLGVGTPCPVGQFCRSAAAGEEPCEPSCDAVAFWWGSLTHSTCNDDEDCILMPGNCSFGLGNCWEVVNRNDLEGGHIEALKQSWSALDCTGPVCDCPPPPSGTRCFNRHCEIVP